MLTESVGVAVLDVPEQARETTPSAVSWGAILAGGVAAASVTLIMLAFGAGVGFAVVSPWSAVATTTTVFHVATGLYLIVTAMIASSIGGYLAGRLRVRWHGVQTREVFFRDTAHGFLTWGFATLLSAAVLTSAAGALAGGFASSVRVVGQAPGLLDGYVDSLLRDQPGTIPSNAESANARAEIGRIFAASFQNGGVFTPADSAYIAQIVAARSGTAQGQAEERVAATIGEAKQTADKARKAAAQLSLWLTASMLIGAFSASLAAVEGGGLRDGTWKYRV